MGKHQEPKALNEIYATIEILKKQGIKPTVPLIAKHLGKVSGSISKVLQYHGVNDLSNSLKENRYKVTTQKILSTIKKLEARDEQVTTTAIAKVLGSTRQHVHAKLKEADELSRLTSAKNKKIYPAIAQALGDFDTADLSIYAISKLPIDGIDKLSYMTLVNLLEKYKIPHSFSVEDRLLQIDTSKYTKEQLHKLVGNHCNYRHLVDTLYRLKLPFKDRKYFKIVDKN